MKRLAKRTVATMLVVVLFLVGFGFYMVRYCLRGADWVSFPVNSHVYNEGILATGSVVDRNGVPLAFIEDGARAYNSSGSIRRATLHVVGDAAGNIGTGMLSAYDTVLMGYNIFDGVYSLSHEGNTVHTTIDADLCVTAYNALNGQNGAVVVYNYETGDVVCMVSAPGFDPTDPPDLSEDESGTDYEGAYINRAISSTFTPGSTFKAVTLAAAIETVPELWEMQFECPGEITVNGDVIRCTAEHGTLDINDAFARSCNCAFAQLALRVGGETIRKYAEKAGLLDAFTASGIPVAAGSFAVASEGSSDLAWSGIGQYNDLVNPLAAARFMGAIASGGSAVDPRLVYKVTTPLGLPAGAYGAGAKHRFLSKDTAETLKAMLRYNVTSYYGDGRFWGLNLCAKSGTAEVAEGKTPHAWFIGFMDDPNNPYAFAVFVEHGGWGVSVAGEVANRVLQQLVNG